MRGGVIWWTVRATRSLCGCIRDTGGEMDGTGTRGSTESLRGVVVRSRTRCETDYKETQTII